MTRGHTDARPLVRGAEVGDPDRSSLLGRFEEAIILAAITCGPNATAGEIKSRISSHLGERHINCVLTTLDRLSRKGFILSKDKLEPSGLRGGRRRKTYVATDEAVSSVRRSLSVLSGLARDAGLDRPEMERSAA